jgi:hypothetical protein
MLLVSYMTFELFELCTPLYDLCPCSFLSSAAIIIAVKMQKLNLIHMVSLRTTLFPCRIFRHLASRNYYNNLMAYALHLSLYVPQVQ